METGKTEKVPLTLLETLQNDFVILPMASTEQGEDDFSHRLSRISQQHRNLMTKNSEAAEFLLASYEHGLIYFLNKK
ncbi:hypothetical protein [Peribacillus kribbensis]|uniref:hypothetical protein n=1 Tax=Peribacillus kribbensis TaxID=356658 RepID=UPI0004099E2B